MFPMRVEGTTETAGPWIGEETHAEAMGLSHLQDLRPWDSGCRLAPTTFGSRALGSLMDRRRASDPGHRFGNGG